MVDSEIWTLFKLLMKSRKCNYCHSHLLIDMNVFVMNTFIAYSLFYFISFLGETKICFDNMKAAVLHIQALGKK